MPVNVDILAAKLRPIADELALLFQGEIVRTQKISSGDLLDSVEGQLVFTSSGFQLQVVGNEYAIFINKGRKPGTKRVPLDAILNWIREKGISSGLNRIESLAFAIQQSIYQKGIKPVPIIDQTIEEILKVYDERIAEIIEQEISTETLT